jgi:hypothetical protein
LPNWLELTFEGVRIDSFVFCPVRPLSYCQVVTLTGLVTDRLVAPCTGPSVAWIVVEPVVKVAAKPFVPAALLIVATDWSVEFQFTMFVRFCVLLSVYVPVVVNCSFCPGPMLGFVGVTEIDTSVAAVTARIVEPVTPPETALMVVDPAPTPEARPAELMVATPVFVELQVTEAVRFWVVPSLKVPVAVNCSVSPLAIEGFVGVTLMEASVAAVTVRVVVPVTLPETALMVADPAPTPEARPAAVIVATPVFVELQVAEVVRFWVVPSLKVPVAVNCWVNPLAIEWLAGVTLIDESVATVTVTVRVVEPEIAPETALMVVDPAPTVEARPEAEMVAAPVFVELQVTEAVRFWVLPSLKVPEAVNCSVSPLAIKGFAGVTLMEESVVAVTVRVVEPEIAPETALMVVDPVPTAEARPAAEMVAVPVFVELHVTEAVRFWVLPSLKVPVAVNCSVSPLAIEGLVGVTLTDASVAALMVSVIFPVTPLNTPWMIVEPVATPVARPPEVIVATAVFSEVQVTEAVISFAVPSAYVAVAVNCSVAPFAIEELPAVTWMDRTVSGLTGEPPGPPQPAPPNAAQMNARSRLLRVPRHVKECNARFLPIAFRSLAGLILMSVLIADWHTLPSIHLRAAGDRYWKYILYTASYLRYAQVQKDRLDSLPSQAYIFPGRDRANRALEESLKFESRIIGKCARSRWRNPGESENNPR